MKKNHSLPRPSGARRITNKDGKRVWAIGDLEFASKRDLFQYFSPEARMERAKAAEEKNENQEQVAE